jgi:phosphate starvation-inducible protein PhoH and related proteins
LTPCECCSSFGAWRATTSERSRHPENINGKIRKSAQVSLRAGRALFYMGEKTAALKKVTLPEEGIKALFGPYDENIKFLEGLLGVRVNLRGNELIIEGDEGDAELVLSILEDFAHLFEEGRRMSNEELKSAFKQIAEDRAYTLRDYFTKTRLNPTGKKQVTARSTNQRRYIEAIEKHDIVFGIGVAGTGKCISSDSLVLSEQGMVEIGALGLGTAPEDYAPLDLLIHGIDGAEPASHVYNGGESDTLRITTRFGFSIEVTPEHPLLALDREGSLNWRRADELREGDTLALQRGGRMFGAKTRVDFSYKPRGLRDFSSKPVALDHLDEEFAYFMGVLTGDGSLRRHNCVVLTSADEEIVAIFYNVASRLGQRVFRNNKDRPYDYIIASVQLRQLLEHLGMSAGTAHTKRIPHSIFTAPEEIVASFMRGLFDTDGTIAKRDGVVSLSSVSEALIRETQIILLNFGIVASKSVKRAKYLGEPHISHQLVIAGVEAERFHELIGFGLERKRALRQFREPNTNLDVVPHIGSLLSGAVHTSTFTRAEHQLFGDYRRERRRPSYAKLEQLVRMLDAHSAFGDPLDQMHDLLNRHLLFAEIVSIERGRARVFDLTVPGTHSFVANGFINHNTYLAVALAVQALMQKRVNRIVLARPAVEAGEKLGFLPGDLQDKVDPYLRPLYDALFDLVDYERVTRLLEKRVIEVAPLAFMRGRAQNLDSLLMTPNGWRKMGEIKAGDLVIGSDGRPKEVIGVFSQGKKQVYRLTMTDGASAVACAEHLWAVSTMEDKRRGKLPRILETQEMLGNFRRNHQYRYELPLLSAPVEFPYRAVPIEPYSLGLLLGDGCISDKTSPSFTTSDAVLVASLQAGLAEMNLKFHRKSAIDYAITNPLAGKGGNKFGAIRNPLRQALRELDLAGTRSATKFIPEDYLFNAAEVRLAVLQGLLDTDGGPVTQEGRTCRIQYTTTSERLKDDVVFLVRSLGGVAYWRKRKAEGRKPGFAGGREVPYRNDAYVLDIRLPEGLDPFRLERKANIYRAHSGGRPMRFIENIEPAGIEETQCISVRAPDSLYVTDDFILTHNTLSDSFIILDEAQNTTSEQMKMFLTRIGFGSKAVITGDVTQIDLPAGRRSGLIEAQRVLKDIEGVQFIYFNEKDVVRHHLVQMIIQAYDKNTKTKFEEKL